MSVAKSAQKISKNQPSTFAMLVDDINKMSESEQKLIWLQINSEKISSFARELDNATPPNNLSAEEIDSLIIEARNHVKAKKKG